MPMNDAQFNDACRTFYESGKLPEPAWKWGGSPYRLYPRGCCEKHRKSMLDVQYEDDGRWRHSHPVSQHEAACINECARREWLETKGCHHSDVGHAHAWFIKPDALGCKEIARKRSWREALLAATRAVLAEEKKEDAIDMTATQAWPPC